MTYSDLFPVRAPVSLTPLVQPDRCLPPLIRPPGKEIRQQLISKLLSIFSKKSSMIYLLDITRGMTLALPSGNMERGFLPGSCSYTRLPITQATQGRSD